MCASIINSKKYQKHEKRMFLTARLIKLGQLKDKQTMRLQSYFHMYLSY